MPGLFEQGKFGADLDYERISHGNVEFYELRLHDVRLSHGGNLRVFFCVDDRRRTIWVVHAYWKKTQQIKDHVLRRVARRVRDLRGDIQDGGACADAGPHKPRLGR